MPRVGLRTIGAATIVLTVLVVVRANRSRPRHRRRRPGPARYGSPTRGHDSITVIDAATNAVTMTLTGIKAPHNIQVARDGAVVYAVSSAGVVVAIDPTTYRVSATAPTGAQPAHVIEAPNGKVYVTNSGDGTVSVYQAPDSARPG